MRTATIAIALASLGSLAFATEARAERRDCEVVFVRAPDDARLVIESWLEAEPRCSGTIELRVVQTETGTLYLIAQRPDGRIHEREVPDAQSAGVLVASWVADDWTSSPPEDTASPPSTVAPITVNPVASGVTTALPPPRAPRSTGRWFGVSGMIQTEGRGGLGGRFEMDLLGGRASRWTLGAALVGVSSSTGVLTRDGHGYMETIDLRALLVAARTWKLTENWNVRWSVGLGPMYTDATIKLSDYGSTPQRMQSAADDVSVAYATGLTVARELFDHRWAITAGLEASVITQTFEGDGDYDMARSNAELMVAFGARYRL